MSLLSHTRLLTLMRTGVIRGINSEQINASSIDIRLGKKILVESSSPYGHLRRVSLHRREPLRMFEVDIEQDNFIFRPGQFILAQSIETFHLPNNISAEYKLKSSMARIGLEHLLSLIHI